MLEKEPFRCPVVNVFNVTYPICLLPIHEDIYVSKAAQSAETYWEHEEIAHIVRLLRHLRNSSERHERNVVFVDLGASIGTYSLPILHNGFKVFESSKLLYNLFYLFVSIIFCGVSRQVGGGGITRNPSKSEFLIIVLTHHVSLNLTLLLFILQTMSFFSLY